MRQLHSRVFCALMVLALVACQGEPAPDAVFLGRFVTLDRAMPEVEALAVTDGRIVAAGAAS
ncbi:MAG: hypothetical protein L0Y45_05445, partial [Woeseiaceae bacterium]|nr:hypothetical protein [Woeseiaceae bacterium]